MHICLFDIDGTLLSSGGAGKAALETALVEDFGLSGLRGHVPYSGRTDRAIIRDLLQLHDIQETKGTFERLVAGYLNRLPDCLRNHRGKVLPGIAGLLEDLSARDEVAVGLLTGNLRAGARIKLGHFGLHDYFAFGGFGDHHWERDDVAREALDAVRTHFNGQVVLERVWVIGDTPLDVQCARAIGVKVAAVATGLHSLVELEAAGPDLVLADLSDAAPLLARWQ
jgi:phosphoglycolate phosphatase-like HAD superfamily hydrolase